MPLILKEQILGVICLYSHAEHAFSSNDCAILRTLAAYTAVALDNAESYKKLKITQAKLVEQEKLAALGSLVAGVAHELNTPIGNSLLMASTMHDMSNVFLAQVQSEQLRRSDLEEFCNNTETSSSLLVRNLNKAASLINSFKQLAVDQTSEKRRQFDLRTVCEEVVLSLSNRLHRAGHKVQLDIPEGIFLDSYPGPFGQVLSNLILNSQLHGLDGRKDGLITIQAGMHHSGAAFLHFRDNGCGIKAEHLARVFDPFFTTKLGKGGSGLGLHISYNIICATLGGSIKVSSESGQGAFFEISLPLQAPYAQNPEQE